MSMIVVKLIGGLELASLIALTHAGEASALLSLLAFVAALIVVYRREGWSGKHRPTAPRRILIDLTYASNEELEN